MHWFSKKPLPKSLKLLIDTLAPGIRASELEPRLREDGGRVERQAQLQVHGHRRSQPGKLPESHSQLQPWEQTMTPRGEVVNQGELCPLGVKLSPGGEILCSPLHSSKQ
jgi:hypothetical protein